MFSTRIRTVVLIATLVAPHALHAQSLGDLAKRTAAQRATAPKAPRVYTNTDLPNTPPTPTPAETSAATPAVPTEPSPPVAPSTAPTNDEAYWRGRVTPLHLQIDSASLSTISLRRRIAVLTAELLETGPLNARRGGIEAERQRLITEAEATETGCVSIEVCWPLLKRRDAEPAHYRAGFANAP
jgi:hypothetical protein